MPPETDDYIGLFDTEPDDFDSCPGPSVLSLSPPEASAVPSAIEAGAEADWHTDPVPTKLEKIRAAFLNVKTAGEVRGMASCLSVADWLELVIKLSPKNVQVSGNVGFLHMLSELGPIDKDKYRIGHVQEAEYKELT